MKKGIISALITIFLLDKSSKGMDERTKRSSWFRTSVYLILALIFAVFFYRTSQVATIINNVEISSLRGYEDSLHNSLDTIEMVYLYNDFKTLGSYQNPHVDYLEKMSPGLEDGNVQVYFQEPSIDSIIRNKDSLTDERKKEIENLTGVPINPNTGTIYSVEFVSRSSPSLIPTFPKMKADKPIVYNDTLFSIIEYVGNLKNIDRYGRKILEYKSEPAEGLFADAFFNKRTTISHYNFVQIESITLQHPLVNKLNVFSACDLSQYTYLLTLSSDMYIKNLTVGYNVPVEVGNNGEELHVGVNNFGIKDSAFLNRFHDRNMCFHVKLPTMTNLQQIRSIILTAIVSALFSLFCTNLFYRVRKMVKFKMLKCRINISEWVKQNRNNLKDSKFLLNTIILVLLLFVLFIVWKGASDYTYLIDSGKDAWWPILSVLLILTLFIVCIYGLYILYNYPNRLGNFVKTLPSKIKHAKKKKNSPFKDKEC